MAKDPKAYKKLFKSFLFTGVSGGLAAYGGDVLYYPFDTLKVRFQASHVKHNYVKSAK